MILLIPILALLDFAMTLIAFLFVNWWAPLFTIQGEVSDRGVTFIGPKLPTWLAWFDTFDASLDAGLPEGQVGTYWTRVKWLYRNPAYGFGYWAIGAKFNPLEWKVEQYEILDVHNNVNFRASGPDGLFNANVIWGGIHWKIGWKAWNYFAIVDGKQGFITDKPWGPEMRVPFTFSFSLPKK